MAFYNFFFSFKYYKKSRLFVNKPKPSSQMSNKPPVALIVFSNDYDDYLSKIESERKLIEEALEHYDDTNRLKIITRSTVSIDELFRLFNKYTGRIALFHFAGHAGGEGLQFNQAITNPETGKAEGIAELIGREVNQGILQLVFLNGCSTAGQVDGLKAVNVPSIIATNAPINDDKAVVFAKQFYRTWAKADNVSEAFNAPLTTIQQGFDAAMSYLKLKNTVVEQESTDTTRGFVFDEVETSVSEPWVFYSSNPDQTLMINIAQGSKAFNEFLTRRLIEGIMPLDQKIAHYITNKIQKKYLDWESIEAVSNQAKQIIVYKFVGVLGIQLQKLFAIGKEALSKEKEQKYIETCLYTAKRTFKLINFALISKLWDYRTQTNDDFQLNSTQKDTIQHFFEDDFELDIAGHFKLFQQLHATFKDNQLEMPFDKLQEVDIEDEILKSTVDKLQQLNQILNNAKFELRHCFAVEKQLVNILQFFIFLAEYQMISIRDIAYDEMRNQSPRYIHTYTALGIDAKQNINAERVRTDDVPINTDAILLFKGKRYQDSVNLFPFIIDWNTLTFENKAKICFYDSKNFNDSSLNYRFLEDNKVANVSPSDEFNTQIDITKIIEDKKKLAKLKLSMVYHQFYEAQAAILGKEQTTSDDFTDLFDDDL